jgi:hypothetical protein
MRRPTASRRPQLSGLEPARLVIGATSPLLLLL